MTRRTGRIRAAWTAGYDAGWRAGTDRETPQHPHLGNLADDTAWMHGWHEGNRDFRATLDACDRYSDYLADGGWTV